MSNKIIAEYIWIDGNGELRSKARTLDNYDFSNYLEPLPNWNYDGSSTYQANSINSEIIIKPCSIFNCPFRKGNNILVMCDTYKSDGTSLEGNNRFLAKELFDRNLETAPWFGIEQEFFIMDRTGIPLGWNSDISNGGQGQFYCSVGSENAFGRELIDIHYEYCLYAGLSISGVNSEVAPGQWEYQIGPVEGINAGDQLYISRYILKRLAEKFQLVINFEPKPIPGDWNGSGCHTNYSTKNMREGTVSINNKSGLDYIKEAITKLYNKHNEHMKLYGKGNEQRMTGINETSKYNEFTSGIGNRNASVRIPCDTAKNKKGYLEDRRPSSNMDPYLVTGILFQTTML